MKKSYISWPQLQTDLERILTQLEANDIIYGIPKGGMIAAGFLLNTATARLSEISLTGDPKEATVIFDDIVDSGATKKKFRKEFPNARFISLYTKKDFPDSWLVFPWEADHPAGEDSVDANIIRILEYIGEDPKREGLVDTPKRVINSWQEIYGGYTKDPKDLLTVFDSDGYDEMVILKDIEMYSTCEHHMLPFYGKAHVAYIPNGRIIGISKLARLVEIYARRLQVQERIGEQVVKALMKYLNPKGAACVIEAKHMCMCTRGINKQNSIMTTSSVKGVFYDKPETRQELMALIQKQ